MEYSFYNDNRWEINIGTFPQTQLLGEQNLCALLLITLRISVCFVAYKFSVQILDVAG